MGVYFGDFWCWLGYALFCPAGPSFLARRPSGQEMQEILESGSSLTLLDNLAREE